jgi:GTPase SAR1 family protein
MAQQKKLKLVMVGDAGVGKTQYLQEVLNVFHGIPPLDLGGKYFQTIGVEVHPVSFQVKDTTVVLNIWDCAGTEKFGGLGDAYWIGANACIIVERTLDASEEKQESWKSPRVSWETIVQKTTGNIPFVRINLDLLKDATKEQKLAPFYEVIAKCLPELA